MNTGKFLSIILCLLSSILGDENEQSRDVYRKMIARRREEHFIIVKNVARNPNLEMRLSLLVVAVERVYEIILQHRDELDREEFNNKISETKITIIENTCLLMDFIVNFSFENLIFRVIKRLDNDQWYSDLKWSLRFTESYLDLLDEVSKKEFYFVKENLARILNFLPLPEYPYENSVKKFLPTKEKIEEYKKNKKIHEKLEKANLVDPIKLEL